MKTQLPSRGPRLDPAVTPTNLFEGDDDDSTSMPGWDKDNTVNSSKLHVPGPSQSTPGIEEKQPVLSKKRDKRSKKNTPRPTYKCEYDECKFTSHYSQNVTRHLQSHTVSSDSTERCRYQCSICQKTFGSQSALKVHVKLHSGLKPHKCDECEYATINIASLRIHMLKHANQYPYKCKDCPFAARTARQLRNHRGRKHSDGTPLICPYCNTTKMVKDDMQTHIRTHTDEKSFKSYECQLCNTSFTRKSSLNDHVLLKHANYATSDLSDSPSSSSCSKDVKRHKRASPKKLKCRSDGCEFTCDYPHQMTEHMSIHIEEQPPHRERKQQPYQCSICQATFRFKKSLTAHELRHAGLKPHKCDQCDYATVDMSAFRRHLLVHKKEYPYKCDLCPFGSRRSGRLAIHRMRAHPPEFQCPDCKTTWKLSANLKAHVCPSIDENIYMCQSCDYSCSTRENLSTHENEKHSPSPTNSSVYHLRSQFRCSLQEQDKTRVVEPVQDPEFAVCNTENHNQSEEPTSQNMISEGDLFAYSDSLPRDVRQDEPTTTIKIESELQEVVTKLDMSVHCDGDDSVNREQEKRSNTNSPSMAGSTQGVLSRPNTINSSELREPLQTIPPAAKKRRVRGDRTTGTTGSRPNNYERKRFKCEEDGCDFAFTNRTALKCHSRVHTGERPYRCSLCPAAFKENQKLKIHELWHAGLKPHKCNKCNYATNNKSCLQRHSKTHTIETPYKCEICPYACRTSTQLTFHELSVHLVDSQFVCPHCEITFKQSSDLKCHIRSHSGEMPNKCQLCNFCCFTKDNLTTHENEKHSPSPSNCSVYDLRSQSRRSIQEQRKTRVVEIVQCPELIVCDTGNHHQTEESTWPNTTSQMGDLFATSDSLPSTGIVRQDEPTMAFIKIESELPKLACELVKTEYDVGEELGQDESTNSTFLSHLLSTPCAVNVNCGKRKHQSEDTTSGTTTTSMETPFGTNTARKSMKITCATSSSRTNGGHPFSDESFECSLEAPTDSPLPSRLLRQDVPTTSSIIMESEPPNVTSELVKVESGVVDEITLSGMNDHEERDDSGDRSETSLRLVEIKVEPEWY